MTTTMMTTQGGFNPNPDVEAPKIICNLEISSESIEEGEPVRLELQVTHTTDVQIDWYKDGQLLAAGSRYDSALERGFAHLDILYTLENDTGEYSCVVRNSGGEVQSNRVSLQVIPEQQINQDVYVDKFAEMDLVEPTRRSELESRYNPTQAPSFAKPITVSESEILEGEGVRFEGQLAQAFDSTVSVEWFKDGKALASGSRFNIVSDRDLILLEIAYSFKDDSGSYVCKVKNAVGEIESQPVQLTCIPEDKVVTRSILDEQSIQQLKAFDDPEDGHSHFVVKEEEKIEPTFTSQLEPDNVEIDEDSEITFTANVNIGNGDKLSIEWMKDHEEIHFGSRLDGNLDRGVASLKILYTQPCDSGEYMCRIRTEHGEAVSNTVHLRCRSAGNVIQESQLKGARANGLQAIEDLENGLNAPKEETNYDDKEITAPLIVRQPDGIPDELEDGLGVHFETLFEPAHDPNMIVEWFKDGEPLNSGTRFRVDYERGLATLDIVYTIKEDTGTYWSRCRNSLGTVESEKIRIVCKGESGVITQSNLLQGSEGYKLIQAIEEGIYEVKNDYEAEQEPEAKPHFDFPPTTLMVPQGGSAKFLVRISGNPTPDIVWTLNGEEIKTDSTVNIYKDGAINYLEINRCTFEQGGYKLKIVATNKLGSAEAETILSVSASEDFRPDLKHVKMANPFKKMIGLKKVEIDQELNKAFSRAKPSAESIIKMERGSEIKTKTFKSPEVLEAENILDKVAVNLRKSEANKYLVKPEAI